jgi:hypothetical protein
VLSLGFVGHARCEGSEPYALQPSIYTIWRLESAGGLRHSRSVEFINCGIRTLMAGRRGGQTMARRLDLSMGHDRSDSGFS